MRCIMNRLFAFEVSDLGDKILCNQTDHLFLFVLHNIIGSSGKGKGASSISI